MSPIRVALALAVITAILATAPAYAQQAGHMTRSQYRHIHRGDTQTLIQNRCDCTGARTLIPEISRNYKAMVYLAANRTFPGDIDTVIVHFRRRHGVWHANAWKRRCELNPPRCWTNQL